MVCGAIAIAVLGALAYNSLATPQYEASTRLFVSTTADRNPTEANDGSLYAQRRVLTYTKLLMGQVLAQRTINKLNLDMSAAELQAEVKASAPTGTVLIDVKVIDPSPSRARDIANTLSDEFVVMTAGLETPAGGTRPSTQVVVQQHAEISDSPVSPRKFRNLAIAAAVGTLLGVVIAIIRDRLDDTVRSSQAIEIATGVELLSSIPFDAQFQKEGAIPFDSNYSAFAEAFRNLRVNLQFLDAGGGHRILLIASPMPDEGRTTTAINLSLALAEADYSVVVVDGDLRHPRVASCLNLSGQAGLSTVLTGGAVLDEALQATRFPRLTALTSGPIPPNPTQLLGSHAAKNVLNELGTEFDYVIVDSPPMLMTDAAILASSVQGALILARSGQTKRKQLEHSTNALRRSGTPLLGTILTMTPAERRSPWPAPKTARRAADDPGRQ